MRILGINALFHDPAAALVIDGRTVAAAEEERFSRRKHGKQPMPFSAWELPGLDAAKVRFVPHQMAHAASSAFAAPDAGDSSVLVLDGRGERASHLAAPRVGDQLEALRAQELPHSLGLVYEELTDHLGFLRSSDEFKVMALASHGSPRMLAEPRPYNLERLNDVKGREQFRPVAPMVLADRAAEIFDGPMPSPYMLFVHDVAESWRERIPAVVHVDGTARIQTVDPAQEPLVARMLGAFERHTGLPVVVNTSLNTAGRPMVDDPRDALEFFGSSPVDLLAIGPYAVQRGDFFRATGEGRA
ncbi:hypothetical protein I2W78_37215 [Streptomyces spinoverrucosus]|uniref:carbamoyltransferase C-terminal domain-containing protein n=1 Tax=Streptomyces spinoverrucosus TaxID=284043 RepID=UPI0018C39B59|nr:carbamoyltransferase C-terminal domain-containing protein [Streptomyces spinoverrucosus]MBG0857340.1 hypothetical protein [Streptomyces spinoverrucosus]